MPRLRTNGHYLSSGIAPPINMDDVLGDCYYFLYKACHRDGCRFRHSESALRTLVVCPRWQNQQKCKVACPYRHSTFHLERNRKDIECYHEKTGKCSKEFCEYKHTEPGRDDWKERPVSQDIHQSPSKSPTYDSMFGFRDNVNTVDGASNFSSRTSGWSVNSDSPKQITPTPPFQNPFKGLNTSTGQNNHNSLAFSAGTNYSKNSDKSVINDFLTNNNQNNSSISVNPQDNTQISCGLSQGSFNIKTTFQNPFSDYSQGFQSGFSTIQASSQTQINTHSVDPTSRDRGSELNMPFTPRNFQSNMNLAALINPFSTSTDINPFETQKNPTADLDQIQSNNNPFITNSEATTWGTNPFSTIKTSNSDLSSQNAPGGLFPRESETNGRPLNTQQSLFYGGSNVSMSTNTPFHVSGNIFQSANLQENKSSLIEQHISANNETFGTNNMLKNASTNGNSGLYSGIFSGLSQTDPQSTANTNAWTNDSLWKAPQAREHAGNVFGQSNSTGQMNTDQNPLNSQHLGQTCFSTMQNTSPPLDMNSTHTGPSSISTNPFANLLESDRKPPNQSGFFSRINQTSSDQTTNAFSLERNVQNDQYSKTVALVNPFADINNALESKTSPSFQNNPMEAPSGSFNSHVNANNPFGQPTDWTGFATSTNIFSKQSDGISDTFLQTSIYQNPFDIDSLFAASKTNLTNLGMGFTDSLKSTRKSADQSNYIHSNPSNAFQPDFTQAQLSGSDSTRATNQTNIFSSLLTGDNNLTGQIYCANVSLDSQQNKSDNLKPDNHLTDTMFVDQFFSNTRQDVSTLGSGTTKQNIWETSASQGGTNIWHPEKFTNIIADNTLINGTNGKFDFDIILDPSEKTETKSTVVTGETEHLGKQNVKPGPDFVNAKEEDRIKSPSARSFEIPTVSASPVKQSVNNYALDSQNQTESARKSLEMVIDSLHDYNQIVKNDPTAGQAPLIGPIQSAQISSDQHTDQSKKKELNNTPSLETVTQEEIEAAKPSDRDISETVNILSETSTNINVVDTKRELLESTNVVSNQQDLSTPSIHIHEEKVCRSGDLTSENMEDLPQHGFLPLESNKKRSIGPTTASEVQEIKVVSSLETTYRDRVTPLLEGKRALTDHGSEVAEFTTTRAQKHTSDAPTMISEITEDAPIGSETNTPWEVPDLRKTDRTEKRTNKSVGLSKIARHGPFLNTNGKHNDDFGKYRHASDPVNDQPAENTKISYNNELSESEESGSDISLRSEETALVPPRRSIEASGKHDFCETTPKKDPYNPKNIDDQSSLYPGDRNIFKTPFRSVNYDENPFSPINNPTTTMSQDSQVSIREKLRQNSFEPSHSSNLNRHKFDNCQSDLDSISQKPFSDKVESTSIHSNQSIEALDTTISPQKSRSFDVLHSDQTNDCREDTTLVELFAKNDDSLCSENVQPAYQSHQRLGNEYIVGSNKNQLFKNGTKKELLDHSLKRSFSAYRRRSTTRLSSNKPSIISTSGFKKPKSYAEKDILMRPGPKQNVPDTTQKDIDYEVPINHFHQYAEGNIQPAIMSHSHHLAEIPKFDHLNESLSYEQSKMCNELNHYDLVSQEAKTSSYDPLNRKITYMQDPDIKKSMIDLFSPFIHEKISKSQDIYLKDVFHDVLQNEESRSAENHDVASKTEYYRKKHKKLTFIESMLG